jgi:hypothetical protein
MKRLKFKMPIKKKAWLIILGLAGLVVILLYFSLPGIAKNVLVSQAEKFGLKNLQFRAIHVGWRRLDLADITVGDAADPDLRIPYLSLEYSLVGLWGKKIKNVRLVGAWIKIEDRGRGFQFRGLTAPPKPRAQSVEMVTVVQLSLEECHVRILWKGRSLEIPLSASLHAMGPNYSFAARLRPLMETVRLQGTIDKNFTAGKLAFMIPGFPLQSLLEQAGLGSMAWGKGRIAVDGEIVLQDGNFKTAAVSVSGLGDLRLAFPDQGSVMLDRFFLAFHLGGGFTARDIIAGAQGRQLRFGELAVASPFQLDIRGRQWPDLEFSIRDLEIASPLPVVVERISGKITGPWTAAQVSGGLRLQNGNGMLAALGLPGEIIRPYAVDADFQGSLKNGNISWTITAKGNRGIAVADGQNSLRGQFDLDASLRGDARRMHASASFRMPAADLQLAGYRARAEAFGGSAELEYVFGGNFLGRGVVRISGGNVAPRAGDGLEASGIRLNLPWHWPGGGPSESGGFSVSRLQSAGMHWQDINGTLTQAETALRFSGSMQSVLAKIALKFQGHYTPNPIGGGLQADFSIPSVVLPARTALQPLHPLLQGTSGGGRFQAEGRIWTGNDSFGGSASMRIADADFDKQKEGITLRGVNAEIKLDRLFDFVTAPAQRIGFRELKWQEMSFTNGELVFAGESGGTVFIESGRFDWCGGKIIIAPFRLEPDQTDFLMTFYCDRVNFAQMLNALLGKTTVSGDAVMSGIVPVRMVKGSPVFSDGYLYSTPGSSGQLKVSQPELISSGQVMVEEAIRDFRYNWIKVKMSSRNDRLDMVVSIDGAPSQKLPLQYDQKQKNFIKDPTGGRHVELKGLLLEIRFSDIDLKDLLKASGQIAAGAHEK